MWQAWLCNQTKIRIYFCQSGVVIQHMQHLLGHGKIVQWITVIRQLQHAGARTSCRCAVCHWIWRVQSEVVDWIIGWTVYEPRAEEYNTAQGYSTMLTCAPPSSFIKCRLLQVADVCGGGGIVLWQLKIWRLGKHCGKKLISSRKNHTRQIFFFQFSSDKTDDYRLDIQHRINSYSWKTVLNLRHMIHVKLWYLS